ncbi:YbaB/EbfC family nucleoid-associated protein [Nonomuraea sp. NPDC004297]
MQGFGEFANIDIDKLLKGADGQLARMEESQKNLESCVGRARDEQGLVTVECGQEGVRELYLHPKALRLSTGDLADLIKTALNDATQDLNVQVTEVMNAAFGDSDDSPTAYVTNPDAALKKIKEAESSYNRTFDDVMGELERIRRRLEL